LTGTFHFALFKKKKKKFFSTKMSQLFGKPTTNWNLALCKCHTAATLAERTIHLDLKSSVVAPFSAVNPSGDLPAHAKGALYLRPASNKIGYSIDFFGLANSVTAIHIHKVSDNSLFLDLKGVQTAAGANVNIKHTIGVADDAAIALKIDALIAKPGDYYLDVAEGVLEPALSSGALAF
jgi:hypothetical protein